MTELHYLISSGLTIDTKGTEAVSLLRTIICQPATDSSCLALELMFEKNPHGFYDRQLGEKLIYTLTIYIYVLSAQRGSHGAHRKQNGY